MSPESTKTGAQLSISSPTCAHPLGPEPGSGGGGRSSHVGVPRSDLIARLSDSRGKTHAESQSEILHLNPCVHGPMAAGGPPTCAPVMRALATPGMVPRRWRWIHFHAPMYTYFLWKFAKEIYRVVHKY
jgi:hypothetical protein